MKFKKIVIPVLLVLTFFFCSFNLSEASELALLKKNNARDFQNAAYLNHIEYQEIDGKIWVIVYSNEGVELERYPFE